MRLTGQVGGMRVLGRLQRGRSLPLLAAAVFLVAGQAPATAVDLYDGAEDHYAGSQIAKVEGIDALPDVLYAADDQQLGHDVSGHQGPVDWSGAAGAGAKFVYVKATEGTGF